jgi:hypothetical protein
VKVHVVFDCVVCLQGAARESGPAGACFRLMSEGHLAVYASHATLAEIVDVRHRPKVADRVGVPVSQSPTCPPPAQRLSLVVPASVKTTYARKCEPVARRTDTPRAM